MDLLFMLVPNEYEPVIAVIAVALFFVSEALSLLPSIKSNGVFQAVGQTLRAIVKKFRPELVQEEAPIEQQEPAGVTDTQRITTPDLTEEQRTQLNAP